MKRGVGREVWDRLLLRLFIPVGLLLLLSPRHSKDVSVEGGRGRLSKSVRRREERSHWESSAHDHYIWRGRRRRRGEGRKEGNFLSFCVCLLCVCSVRGEEGGEGGTVGGVAVEKRKEGRKGGLFLPLLLYGSGLPLLHPLLPPCVCKLVTGVSLPLLRFCVGRQKRNRRGRGRWGLSTGSVPRRFLPFLPSQRKEEKEPLRL